MFHEIFNYKYSYIHKLVTKNYVVENGAVV